MPIMFSSTSGIGMHLVKHRLFQLRRNGNPGKSDIAIIIKLSQYQQYCLIDTCLVPKCTVILLVVLMVVVALFFHSM